MADARTTHAEGGAYGARMCPTKQARTLRDSERRQRHGPSPLDPARPPAEPCPVDDTPTTGGPSMANRTCDGSASPWGRVTPRPVEAQPWKCTEFWSEPLIDNDAVAVDRPARSAVVPSGILGIVCTTVTRGNWVPVRSGPRETDGRRRAERLSASFSRPGSLAETSRPGLPCPGARSPGPRLGSLPRSRTCPATAAWST